MFTCLGRAGEPLYHCTKAFHKELGTNWKSLPRNSILRLSWPPSPVNDVTFEVGTDTSPVLFIGPGLQILTFLPIIGDCVGLK